MGQGEAAGIDGRMTRHHVEKAKCGADAIGGHHGRPGCASQHLVRTASSTLAPPVPQS